MKNDELIKISNVSKKFLVKNGQVEVLNDVNVSIKRGSFTILYGPSGSGKSTLLNIISGLEPPTHGTMTFSGTDVYKLSNNQRASFRALYLGIVYQANYWVNSISTLENVATPKYLLGASYREGITAAKKALARVKMDDYTTRDPGLLSSGQQQRIQMARALVNEAPLILADEPTGNLDTANGDMVMNLLAKCREDMGQTIILATHNLEYLPLSDSQIFVKDGVVTQSFGSYSTPGNVVSNAWESAKAKVRHK